MLSYAEQVILRHVLADAERTSELAALDAVGKWSGETTARAVALLRGRPMSIDTEQWLQSLPDGAATTLLRTIWTDPSISDVPWEDAVRELQRQRGRRQLAEMADRLQALTSMPDARHTFGMLLRLLVEYKRLRSFISEQVQQ